MQTAQGKNFSNSIKYGHARQKTVTQIMKGKIPAASKYIKYNFLPNIYTLKCGGKVLTNKCKFGKRGTLSNPLDCQITDNISYW